MVILIDFQFRIEIVTPQLTTHWLWVAQVSGSSLGWCKHNFSLSNEMKMKWQFSLIISQNTPYLNCAHLGPLWSPSKPCRGLLAAAPLKSQIDWVSFTLTFFVKCHIYFCQRLPRQLIYPYADVNTWHDSTFRPCPKPVLPTSNAL